MTKRYRVTKADVIEGRPEREGATVLLTDDEAKLYKDSLEAIESTESAKVETVDLSPSELPPFAHHTKNAAVVEKDAKKSDEPKAQRG